MNSVNDAQFFKNERFICSCDLPEPQPVDIDIVDCDNCGNPINADKGLYTEDTMNVFCCEACYEEWKERREDAGDRVCVDSNSGNTADNSGHDCTDRR